jgi:hypothetical protein
VNALKILQANSPDSQQSFNNEAIKLAAIGGTIIVSSGDDGVSGRDGLCDNDSGSGNSNWNVSVVYLV